MKRALFLLLFFFFSVSHKVHAQGAEQKRIVLAGVDALYNMRFDEADSYFSESIRKFPQSTIGYHFRATIFLWRYLFDNSTPDFGKFIVAADKTIEIAEAALDKNPDDPEAKAYSGATYGFRAIANVKAENYVKASWDLRECYTLMTDVLKKNPQYYEAYLGSGMFNFVIGSIPSGMRWAVNLAGLSGDKERGFREIEIAATKADFTRSTAKLTLGLLYVYSKGDYTKGITHLKELLQQYPTNVPVLYALGNIECQLKKVRNAIPYFKKTLDIANDNFKLFTVYSNYRLGEVYYRLNEYEEAKKYFQKYLKNAFEKSFKTSGFYRLALCYELTGNREEAVKGYRRAVEMTAVTPEDVYAKRRAAEFLQAPISDAQKQLILGENYIEASEFTKGEPILRLLAMNVNVPKDVQAEANYYVGESLRMQGKLSAALPFFQKVIELNVQAEKWLTPWAYYRMSECYYGLNNMELSRTNLDRVQVFKGYDFHEWLLFAVDRDLKRIQ